MNSHKNNYEGIDDPLPITKPTHQLFLGLGSNLGDRQANLRRAVRALADLMLIETISPIYQTTPWGLEAQPDFLNLCLSATTLLKPLPLLTEIKQIEIELGRQPNIRWGARLIDIDILFYNDQIVTEKTLTIPHAHVAERAFVLAPLADLAPHFCHPQTGLTVAQMLVEVGGTAVHKLPQPLFEEMP